jgi:hypothetical protein
MSISAVNHRLILSTDERSPHGAASAGPDLFLRWRPGRSVNSAGPPQSRRMAVRRAEVGGNSLSISLPPRSKRDGVVSGISGRPGRASIRSGSTPGSTGALGQGQQLGSFDRTAPRPRRAGETHTLFVRTTRCGVSSLPRPGSVDMLPVVSVRFFVEPTWTLPKSSWDGVSWQAGVYPGSLSPSFPLQDISTIASTTDEMSHFTCASPSAA